MGQIRVAEPHANYGHLMPPHQHDTAPIMHIVTYYCHKWMGSLLAAGLRPSLRVRPGKLLKAPTKPHPLTLLPGCCSCCLRGRRVDCFLPDGRCCSG